MYFLNNNNIIMYIFYLAVYLLLCEQLKNTFQVFYKCNYLIAALILANEDIFKQVSLLNEQNK